MTQAVNLANFANYLDSGGGLSPNALNSPTPLTKGGTGNTTGAAVSIQTTNFSIAESGGNLLIKYGATTIATISPAGDISAGI